MSKCHRGECMAGKNLRAIRKKMKITQVQLQVATGIEQASISKYENGERVIPTDTLMLLAEYFHTSTDYLLDLTDDPTPPQKK